jgi:hypothetical protein
LTEEEKIEEQYFSYLRLICTDIGLERIELNEDETIVYIVNMETTKYSDFVKFINRKYTCYPEPIVSLPFKEDSNDKEFIRENAEFDGISKRIAFDRVEKQSEKFYKILEISFNYIRDFQKSLNMLEILMKDHKNKKIVRNALFSTLDKGNSVIKFEGIEL